MDDQNGEEPLQPLYDNFTLEQLLRGINSSNIDFGNNLNFSQGDDTYAHGIFQSEGHPKDDDPMNFWWQNLIHPNPTGNDFRQSHSGHTSPSFSSGEASPTFFNHSQQYPLYNNIGGNLVLNHSDLNSDFSQNPDCFHGGLTYDKLSTLSNNDFKNELPKCQQNPAQNWTNGMPEYHPFQSSTVLQDVEKDVSIDAKPKRSYSDVAKKQPHVSDTASISRSHFKEKRSSSLPEESKTTPPPVYKIRKKNIKSNSVLKKHKRFDTLASNVEPDAKYGLDTFDDNLINPSNDDTFINGGLDDIDDVPASFGSQSKKMTSSGKKCSVDDLSADYSSAKTKKPSTKERPFFDPKRIFQPKTNNTANLATKPKHNKKSSIDCQTGDIIDDCSFILNNGKCCPNITGSPPAATKTTTYINNDLRDRFEPRKQTNTDTKQNRSQPSMDTRASKNLKGSKDMHATEQLDSSTRAQRKMFRKQSQKFQLLGQVCNVMRRWFHWFFIEVLLALIVLAIMVSYKLVVITVFKLCHCISFALAKTVQFVKKHLQSWFTSTSSEKSWSAKDSGYPMFGLDENIVLPTTGEEAMKRLLAGRGKDPYSILGLKSNCSDEDIRRYYRKQAVLVHPDKNPQPGAEEAFKILGHAFELIGKPEKRALYDQQFCENKAAEEAMKEFTDLLAKLREKVQEAAYLMRCDRCGGKHRRLPIERPWYSARQCDRCNTRHSAKEGDLWAESTFLGFLWHYYAWMDGKMYDITEWASCQRENFKHMQANAHYVMYRIATNSNRQNQHTHGRSGENDLEDFINHLIHRTMQSDSDHSSYAAPGSQSSRPAWTPGPATTATKGKKRRKRKH